MQYAHAAAVVVGLFAASLLGSSLVSMGDDAAPRGGRDDAAARDACRDAAGPKDKSLPTGPVDVLSGRSETLQVKVPSVGGHQVPVTIHKPVEANAHNRTPVLLHSHGWSGTRASGANAFEAYHKGGFGVASLDMRGHGDARTTSAARVHDMEFEIKDVSSVITYLAGLDWVRLETAGDPVVGALGGSYGGGYQLLTAAVDPRLDAIAPEITWNDLPQSLVPNGAPKSAWVDVLYGSGLARTQLDATVHEGFAVLETQNRIPDGRLPGEPDLKTRFTKSSPKSYPDAIRIPTFLIQGANDTLFNVNEAVRNYHQIRATCAPVQLLTHLGGHILNTQGTLAAPTPTAVGLQGPAGGSPCGGLTNLTIRFYQRHLLDAKIARGDPVCLALDDASKRTGASFPLPGTSVLNVSLPAQTVPQGIPFSTAVDVGGPATVDVLLGIPVLSGKVTNAAPDAIVYFGLQATGSAGSRILNAQVTPLRVTTASSEQAFRIELGAVATDLRPGEHLELLVTSHQDQFAHNAERVPGLATLAALQLELPLVE
ncbi:MAG: alpha/beta fold hydrolase [Euryarchaeota archaeon]|nr:alpha/beta fold hydrolase [Euryarchaeota archaeon]